jgi:hypothetical protein
MSTIDIPGFWSFRMACTCPYGSLVADQRPYKVIATEEQAWSEFYEGRKREMKKDQKSGAYVVPEAEFNAARFVSAHDHPDCTRTKEPLG